jgi:hypothetical protein
VQRCGEQELTIWPEHQRRSRAKRHNFARTLAFRRKIRISRPVRNPVFWLVAERRAGFPQGESFGTEAFQPPVSPLSTVSETLFLLGFTLSGAVVEA